MTIRWGPRASLDVREIWLHIAAADPARADAWLERLIDKVDTLERHPMLGRERDEVEPGLRSFTLRRYVIWYRPIRDGVDITRVLHGARDVFGESFD